MAMVSPISFRATLIILILGIFTYLYGLDSRFAPKNGDEYPYMHIVRMTADSGHWLPLQSQMEGIKNTKPPLIFWQGIASTQWGSLWSLENLRWPSILYTGLTAFFLCLAVGRFSGNARTGMLAAFTWLSFFATYRYGRPFLADPPEVFWISLPFMALLYWSKDALDSKFFFPAFAGICFGVALLAKSFAYIAPASLALALYYWRWREWSISQTLVRDLYKIIFICILALGIFALWFALDPDPEAVWKEFVLGENAGKFAARNSNYLLDFVRGGDSIWLLLLTTLANAGFFFFVLITTLWQCWRGRRFLDIHEVFLLLLIAAFLFIFSLPSQRSGRYLLPVMPAFAALIALHWNRLPLWGFQVALYLQLLVLSLLMWIGLNLQLSDSVFQSSPWSYSPIHWVLMVTSLLIILIGLLRPNKSKVLALASCFLVYCALTSSLAPLEGQLGRYSTQTIRGLEGRDVWVPCDYRAKDEEYRLLLPGVQLHGYEAKDATAVNNLTNAYPVVALHAPLGVAPELCDSCQIIGQRMEMRARHSNDEIIAMLQGQIGQHLFVTEYLVQTPAPNPDLTIVKDACR